MKKNFQTNFRNGLGKLIYYFEVHRNADERPMDAMKWSQNFVERCAKNGPMSEGFKISLENASVFGMQSKKQLLYRIFALYKSTFK
jgi:hypothetical protein